jgi:hypothetical protein
LIITNRSIRHSLLTARAERGLPPEVVWKIDDLVAVGLEGENQLRQPMEAAGIVPPRETHPANGAAETPLFGRTPASIGFQNRAVQLVINLRLLAQHLELRARLAAEEARLVGQKSLRRALLAWAAEWYVCGQHLQTNPTPLPDREELASIGEPMLQRS